MSIIGKQKFRLIGLSVADQKACEKDSEVDRILRAIRKLKIPIVAGGNLANSSARILKGLHIDLVTNDVAHALNYFNINFSAKRYHPESINV